MMESVKFSNSSRLVEASYESTSGQGGNETGNLYVTFKDKSYSRYKYSGVPRIDWVRLAITEKTGDSAGKVFERYIKGGEYPYIKLQ